MWPKAEHFTVPFLDWAYNRNPAGPALGFNAATGGRLVGHLPAQPFRARIQGGEEKGLLLFNVAVHPEFRGRNLFQKLARATLEQARAEGFGFVIGVANAQITLLYSRVLKFQLVCPLDVWVGAGPVAGGRSAADYGRIWDRESLAWRLGRPGAPYAAQSRGADTAYLAPTAYRGIHAELGVFPEEVAVPAPSFKALSPLRLWIGLCPGRRRPAFFCLPVPMKFRPSPLNLVFKDLSPRGRLLDPRTTLFNLIDFDAY